MNCDICGVTNDTGEKWTSINFASLSLMHNGLAVDDHPDDMVKWDRKLCRRCSADLQIWVKTRKKIKMVTE